MPNKILPLAITAKTFIVFIIINAGEYFSSKKLEDFNEDVQAKA